MKKALMFAAVAEAGTGLALATVPSLVGQLLLGQELTGIAIAVARVTGIALIALGVWLLAGPTARRHADLHDTRRAVSRLSWRRRRFQRYPIVARRHPSRDLRSS